MVLAADVVACADGLVVVSDVAVVAVAVAVGSVDAVGSGVGSVLDAGVVVSVGTDAVGAVTSSTTGGTTPGSTACAVAVAVAGVVGTGATEVAAVVADAGSARVVALSTTGVAGSLMAPWASTASGTAAKLSVQTARATGSHCFWGGRAGARRREPCPAAR
ncbi:hypothetical protein ASG36_07235 [Geodermatophilus sp. Leaf369]|uniref:hypothetical protein n=1 Tax=Geodermatophilus sp. Leaf369 TaxID=1736354 RepID=UPI0006FD88EB|nr:hypothetical protein [Geodermatophilus sp. Leaf369]KQS60671.1 hypothetical protein ASG36_07235 [Geodermatophilus sp. Leaf369]